jgi:hypothetical protein
MQNSGASRRENADAYPLGCLTVESEMVKALYPSTSGLECALCYRLPYGLVQRRLPQHFQHQLHRHQHRIVATHQPALGKAAGIVDE